MKNWLRNVLIELGFSLRLFFRGRPAPPSVPISLSVIGSLILLYLVVAAATDAVAGRTDLQLNWMGVGSHVLQLTAVAAILLVWKLVLNALPAWRIFAASIGIGILAPLPLIATSLSISSLGEDSSPLAMMFAFGGAVGVVLAAVVAHWRLGRFAWRRHRILGGMLLVLPQLAISIFWPNVPLVVGKENAIASPTIFEIARGWVGGMASSSWGSPAAVDAPRSSLAMEREIFRQFEIVKSSTDALLKSDGQQPHYYFLGAALYGYQGVFRREVTSAQRIVDERLGTVGRSLVMINSNVAVAGTPLATEATLEFALTELAAKMNVEQDVLIFYLSSHGGPGQISVSTPWLNVSSITPGALRRMLDAAKIKNRVIIVSACYSGSFIDELDTPDTLVMTAARSDRTSFGCADENEWTYFGNAFFNHALKQTRSLPDAFQISKDLIGTWEEQQKLMRSEPQLWMGQKIREKLQSMPQAK